MAPRQLIVRWRKDKMRRKLASPKAFASKASGGLSKHAMREHAAFQYNARGGGTVSFQRLEHYINTRKPHHRILFWIFSRTFRDVDERNYTPGRFDSNTMPYQVYPGETIEEARERARKTFEESPHPQVAVELLLEQYINQDPRLDVFKFDVVVLENSDYHDKLMYFRGQECFLVFRRDKEVRKSKMYMNPMFLKRLSLKKVEWVGEVMHLDEVSPQDENTS